MYFVPNLRKGMGHESSYFNRLTLLLVFLHLLKRDLENFFTTNDRLSFQEMRLHNHQYSPCASSMSMQDSCRPLLYHLLPKYSRKPEAAKLEMVLSLCLSVHESDLKDALLLPIHLFYLLPGL